VEAGQLGFVVPERDGEQILKRRVVQCHEAFHAVRGLKFDKRVMVQAGGNWGFWPRQFAEMFDTVYTFEPDRDCFTCLVANTQDKKNVVCIQAALGYDRELVDLWRDTDTTGNQHVEGKGIYPTLRIDDLGLDVCDLIYLDIEGREQQALKGAEATIEACQPVIIFEERKVFQQQADQAFWRLEDLGYTHVRTIGNKDVVMWPKRLPVPSA
jgi:FkbM family methyltransferase